jgi:hypothetical protein
VFKNWADGVGTDVGTLQAKIGTKLTMQLENYMATGTFPE